MSRPNRSDPSSLPYQVDPRFEFVAVGGWQTGGLLEIRWQGKLTDTLSLPASEWTAMAALIHASLKSQHDHKAKAFVFADELGALVQELSHRGTGTATAAHAVIHKLRALFSRSTAAELSLGTGRTTERWGKLVIEKHVRFGYRVSVDPSQLTLILLDETEADEPAENDNA